MGFYDGMFGPGAGSFFVMTGVMLKKLEIIQATILAKPLNFASNIAGFIVFLYIWTHRLCCGFGYDARTIGWIIFGNPLLTESQSQID